MLCIDWVEACVAGRLTLRTLDLEVLDSNLARRVVSLDKELYSSLSLFIQVYKSVPATFCWGVTLRWTSIQSRSSNTPRLASYYGNRPCGPLARAHLYICIDWRQQCLYFSLCQWSEAVFKRVLRKTYLC